MDDGTMTAPNAPQYSSPDEIFSDVVRGLYDGRYAPGQRLVEADIAREYAVSRGTAREALKRLASEGLVTTNLHQSARIRRLSRKEMRDILGIMELLTGYSCRLCAARMADPETRSIFADHYEKLMSFREDNDRMGFVRARNRFFRSLVELSDNSELQRLMPKLQIHLIRVQLQNSRVDDAMTWLQGYAEIGEAVLRGEADLAEAAGKRHVRQFADLIETLPENLFAS